MYISDENNNRVLNSDNLISVGINPIKSGNWTVYQIIATTTIISHKTESQSSSMRSHYSAAVGYAISVREPDGTTTQYHHKEMVIAQYDTYELANRVMARYCQALSDGCKTFHFPNERIDSDWIGFFEQKPKEKKEEKMTDITFSRKDVMTFGDLECGTFFYNDDDVYFKLDTNYFMSPDCKMPRNAVDILASNIVYFEDDAPVTEIEKCNFS